MMSNKTLQLRKKNIQSINSIINKQSLNLYYFYIYILNETLKLDFVVKKNLYIKYNLLINKLILFIYI